MEKNKKFLGYKNIVLHIPHSSRLFPKHSAHSFDLLDDEEKKLIDFYTDELFIPQGKDDRIKSVVFPYCRLYCDVERLCNDPLEREGLGISYGRWAYKGNHTTIYRSLGKSLYAYRDYLNFHSDMAMILAEDLTTPLLIDCHSFSSLPNLLNKTSSDIDICIGYNEDETRPGLVVMGNIKNHFQNLGYKVGINNPFSNSKTFNVPGLYQYHSVMIEVNKRLYMNEFSIEKNDRFEKIKTDIQSLYNNLLYPVK